MKQLITALCLALALAPVAFAQEKGKSAEKKSEVATQKSANTDMSKGKGSEKKSTPEKSAKREPTEKQKAQHARMRDCTQKAGDRKGDERKKFMSECLSKS